MKIELVNNTCLDIRGMIEDAILVAIRNGGTLPEELSDLFVLTQAANGRWILEVA